MKSKKESDLICERFAVVVPQENVDSTIETNNAFKYELVEKSKRKSMEYRLVFERPIEFENSDKVKKLEEEYNNLYKKINEFNDDNSYSYVDYNGLYVCLFFGGFFVLFGIVICILSQVPFTLILTGAGLLISIPGDIFLARLIRNNRKRNTKIKQFETKSADYLERMDEIIEELKKL